MRIKNISLRNRKIMVAPLEVGKMDIDRRPVLRKEKKKGSDCRSFILRNMFVGF